MALVETFNSASIGLSRLHFAKMENKGSATDYPSYGGFVRIDGLVNGTIRPNSSVESDHAENRVHEIVIDYGAADISLEVTGLGPAGYQFVTGRTISAAGGTVMMAGQQAPNLAVAFEVLNGQRKRVRYVVYDAMFPEGEISLQTKGDGIEFGHVPLEGQIADLLYEGAITKKSDGSLVTAEGIRFMTMTEDGEDYDPVRWNAWFQTVQFPTGDVTALAVDFEEFSFAAGSSAGDSVLTVVSPEADNFAYVIGKRDRPMAGLPIDGGHSTDSGSTIPGLTPGQVITVYGLTAEGKAASFGTHVMLVSEIKD